MEPDDTKTIVDIHNVKNIQNSRQNMKSFGKKQKNFREGLGTAVDDCWHLEIAHLSTAISVYMHDFKEQIQIRCPESTTVPCEE